MEPMIELRIAELLASRLCHDLVGPIGAVNNGMELLADEEFGMADDAVELASKSAAQAADVLQFFRLAYGLAGSQQGGDLRGMRELAVKFLSHGKAKLDWPDVLLPEEAPGDVGKLLLNMTALASEALPRGGTIAVKHVTAVAGGLQLDVTAHGSDAGLRPESQSALADDARIADLTPRSVQGYFTRLLARRLGGDLVVKAAAGSLQLAVTLPS